MNEQANAAAQPAGLNGIPMAVPPEAIFAERTARLIRRAHDFARKAKTRGLFALGDDIDAEGLGRRDVFEYGIRLAVENAGARHVGDILSNMAALGESEDARRLMTMQKEAALGIQEGRHPKLLACALLSHLDGGERAEVLGRLKGTEAYDAILYFDDDKVSDTGPAFQGGER